MTLQEVLMRRGIQVRTTSGDQAKLHICCPFCIERGKPADTKFRLCVHAKQGWGKCVHCEWKHRYAAGPVLRQFGLAADGITGVPMHSEEEERVPPPKLPRDFQVLTRTYDDLDKQALRYIRRRGVTMDQIKRCRIGVSYDGRYAYRILFPIFIEKELKAINARDFTGVQKAKYLNSLGDKFLFNFNPSKKTIVLSEGAIKALRIEQVVDTWDWGSASLLGHDLTDTMLEQIKSSECARIVLYPDPDSVGVKGFVGVAEKLSESWNGRVQWVRHVTVAADDAPLDDLRKLFKHNVVDYTSSLSGQRLSSSFAINIRKH